MKKIILFLSSVLLLNSYVFAQYRVILDADIDSDVDDVEALAMVHTLANQKEIRFLGVIVTSDDPFAAVCTSVINKYYGRPRLPIGVLKNQENLKNHSRYTRQIATEFPHNLKSHEKAEDGTTVYRKLLSKSPDASVVIITIGHLSNFQNLLKSGGDKYSALSGKELVNKKVVKWLCMGGQYPAGKEANFYRPDPGSTIYSLQNWEKPVVFAGWEVGEKIISGGEYLKNKLPPASPVYRAYELYNNFKGRASWDQVAVFLLKDDAHKYFQTVKNGFNLILPDGSNKWMPGQQSQHEYLQFKPGVNYEEIARLMDDMAIR